MKVSNNSSSYLYNVEILIEDENHKQAYIQLLQKLNSLNVVDYKITSGVELGQEIQARKNKATKQQPIPVSSETMKETSSKKERKESDSKSFIITGLDELKTFKDDNALIRLIVNRGFGVKLNIPCRVLNIDEAEQLISVYHVDEKQVYTFKVYEIEDIIKQ